MTWSVSEAKAKLSEVLQRARRTAQVIESRGEAVAVVISKSEYDRLQSLGHEPRPTALAQLIEWTEALKAEGDLELDADPRRVEPDRALTLGD